MKHMKIMYTLIFSSREITDDIITGKYKFVNNEMFIEVKAKSDWLTDILEWNWNRTVWLSERHLEFVETEYFECTA